jgi:hypothetical protein
MDGTTAAGWDSRGDRFPDHLAGRNLFGSTNAQKTTASVAGFSRIHKRIKKFWSKCRLFMVFAFCFLKFL